MSSGATVSLLWGQEGFSIQGLQTGINSALGPREEENHYSNEWKWGSFTSWSRIKMEP